MARVRQVISTAAPQVEELRVGDNVKRRRRVAPVPGDAAGTAAGECRKLKRRRRSLPEEAAKPRKPKETMARVVSPYLPKKSGAGKKLRRRPWPRNCAGAGEVSARRPRRRRRPRPQRRAAACPGGSQAPGLRLRRPIRHRLETTARQGQEEGDAGPDHQPAPGEVTACSAPPHCEAPAERARPRRSGPHARPGARPMPGAARPAPERPGRQAGACQTPVRWKRRRTIKGKKKTVKRPEVPDAVRAKPVKKREVRERADLYGGAEGEHRGSGRRKGMKKAIKKLTKGELTVPKAIKRRVKVGESITVGELAKRMGIKSGAIIKQLLQMGVIANINYPIDFDSATIVAGEFGYEVEHASMQEEDLLAVGPRQEGEAKPRPPVVTIMGHVDHGKTSLLDAIRRTRVTEGEAGGITQHIGAYYVELPEKQGEVVFLDTPGHEAFTAMRARGAKVTDLVVLVVAADDGVMEQTTEAINHAKAAGVPLVVAVNKIDKPNANPERVKRELSQAGVVSEEWGGDVLFAEVSAKQRIGIKELLEKILLQAEILDLKAVADVPASGRIIESRLDKGRGPVGTVLVQEGTLKPGDYFVCGPQYGRVRALFDDRGEKVEEVPPGLPAEVQGFNGVPEAGDEFMVLEDERKAKQIAMMRQQKLREASHGPHQPGNPGEALPAGKRRRGQGAQDGAQGRRARLHRGPGQGPVRTGDQGHQGLDDPCRTGEVSENDIMLASASDAIVVGFNVRANPKALALAEQEQVDVRYYDIIYNLLQDIHAALEGLLEPIVEEKVMGRAEVRQVFSITKVGTIAGCMVLDGKIERNSLARVVRKGKVVSEGGKINSLKRFKDDVKEVLVGV